MQFTLAKQCVCVVQKDLHRTGDYGAASYRLLLATSSVFRIENAAPPLLQTLFSFFLTRDLVFCPSELWNSPTHERKKNSTSPLWNKSSRKFQWPSPARKTRSFLISRRAKALFHKPEYMFCHENKVWEAERKFNPAIFERTRDGNFPAEMLLSELLPCTAALVIFVCANFVYRLYSLRL